MCEFFIMLYKKPRHPKRPMSWFWCVQNKHTRGREQKRDSRERGAGGGGVKVKRGFREGERGLQKESAEGGEEIRGAGEERGLNESRRECMWWRSLWGEIFPLRGAALGSQISRAELCCQTRILQGDNRCHQRNSSSATDIQTLCAATVRRRGGREGGEAGERETGGDKPPPL